MNYDTPIDGTTPTGTTTPTSVAPTTNVGTLAMDDRRRIRKPKCHALDAAAPSPSAIGEAMSRKKFSELRDRMSPEAQQEVKARSDEMLQAMTDTLSPQEREAAEQLLERIRFISRPGAAADTRLAQFNAILAAFAEVKRQERERLHGALKNAYVILEGLRRSVEWELAPSIMAAIQRSAVQLEAELRASAESPGDNK